MKKVRMSELDESIRSFLITGSNGIIIEDENGRAQYGVIPYQEATAAERKQAWQEIEEIQSKVGQSMQQQGVTEDDIDNLLQEDE